MCLQEAADQEIIRKNAMVSERNEQNKLLQKANERLQKERDNISASKAELEKHRDALKQELLAVQAELESQIRQADGCVTCCYLKASFLTSCIHF